jgi:cell division septum initiation protein DivIVA
MDRTSLLGSRRISGDQARRVNFPSQVLGGYRPGDVEAFRTRVTAELDTLGRALEDSQAQTLELEREVVRLSEELAQVRSHRPAAVSGEHAIDILSVAQGHADQLVAGAKQEADRLVSTAGHEARQMTEHARQQAAGIIRQATNEGGAEKARIIDSATAESRRQASFYAGLARAMGDGLGGQVETLLKNLSEWESQARQGAREPAPA